MLVPIAVLLLSLYALSAVFIYGNHPRLISVPFRALAGVLNLAFVWAAAALPWALIAFALWLVVAPAAFGLAWLTARLARLSGYGRSPPAELPRLPPS